MDQLDIIKRLTTENKSLQQQIIHYKQCWWKTLYLIQDGYKAIVVLQDILQQYYNKKEVVEQDQLAFQEIYRQYKTNLSKSMAEQI